MYDNTHSVTSVTINATSMSAATRASGASVARGQRVKKRGITSEMTHGSNGDVWDFLGDTVHVEIEESLDPRERFEDELTIEQLISKARKLSNTRLLVHRIAREIDWPVHFMKFLRNIVTPPRDVLDYVEELPGERSIRNAREIIVHVAKRDQVRAPDLVIATGDGGVGMVWFMESSQVEVECDNDGELYINLNGEFESFQCMDDVPWKELINVLRQAGKGTRRQA